MLRLLCTAEFDDGWTERFGKLVEIDRVGFSLDKDPATKNCRRKYCINVLI